MKATEVEREIRIGLERGRTRLQLLEDEAAKIRGRLAEIETATLDESRRQYERQAALDIVCALIEKSEQGAPRACSRPVSA